MNNSSNYRCLSSPFILNIIRDAEKIGYKAAAKKYGETEKTIMEWVNRKDEIIVISSAEQTEGKNIDRKVRYPWLHDMVFQQLSHRWENNLPVNDEYIREKANLIIANQKGSRIPLRVSKGWVYNFKERLKFRYPDIVKNFEISSRAMSAINRNNKMNNKVAADETEEKKEKEEEQQCPPAAVQLKIIEDAEVIGTKAASKKYGIDKMKITTFVHSKKEIIGFLRSTQQLNEIVFDSLRRNRWEKKLPVNDEYIKNAANTIAKKEYKMSFTASKGWVFRFKKWVKAVHPEFNFKRQQHTLMGKLKREQYQQ